MDYLFYVYRKMRCNICSGLIERWRSGMRWAFALGCSDLFPILYDKKMGESTQLVCQIAREEMGGPKPGRKTSPLCSLLYESIRTTTHQRVICF